MCSSMDDCWSYRIISSIVLDGRCIRIDVTEILQLEDGKGLSEGLRCLRDVARSVIGAGRRSRGEKVFES